MNTTDLQKELDTEIIKDWGLDSFPSEDQQKLLSQIDEMLMQAVLLRGIELLTDEEQEELDLNLETVSEDDKFRYTFEFFETKITDFNDVISEELQKIRSIFVKD